MLLAVSMLAVPLCATATDSAQPPHSVPEYNQRFTQDALAPILEPGKVFHVSVTDGSDSGDGAVEGLESKRRGKFTDLPDEGVFELPESIQLSAFRDVESLDFRFRTGFEPMEGFKPIPFEKIGLICSEFRPDPPDRAQYRSAVYAKFKNDRARRYDPELVNARYPLPSYLR